MKRILIASLGVTMLVLGLAQPAQAATGTPLDQCVSTATAAGFQQWECYGGTLHVGQNAAGTEVDTTQVIAAETGDESSYGVMKGGDVDDIWCETGTICSNRTEYTSKTKGNMAYGNQNGAIGAVDVLLYTKLNGRQQIWTVKLIWDSGPAVQFLNPSVDCIQKGFLWAIDCGRKYTNANPTMSSTNYLWKSGYVYGNKMVNPDQYWAKLEYDFDPYGYPIYHGLVLTSRVLNCPSGSGNCTFP